MWQPILNTPQQQTGGWQPILSTQPQTVAKPSFFSDPFGAIKNYAVDSFNQAKTFETNLFTHPIKTITGVPGIFADKIIGSAQGGFNEGTQAVNAMLQDYQKGTGSTAGDVANLAKLASGVAGVLFSPITGTFNAAEQIPGLKQVADAVNVPFTAIGVASSYATGEIIDKLLPISQQSKDILKQPLQELTSTIAQVALGGKIMDLAGGLLKSKGDITPVEAQAIVEHAKAVTPEAQGAVKSPIQPWEPVSAEGKPIAPSVAPETAPTSVSSPETQNVSPSLNEVPLTADSTFAEKTQSGLGQSIERKAIEANLTKKFENVAGYDASTIKEQANIFSNLIENKGIDEARAILRGEKPLPESAKSFPFIVNMEAYLKDHPNADLAYELANSPHVSAASEAASQLGLGQNRTQDSYTARIQDIRKAREVKIKDAPKKQATFRKEASKATKEVSLTSEDLGRIDKFIDSIIC